jgi:hypothetical protein
MGTGVAGEMPGDQRIDDGLSLCFDSAPLTEEVEILGFPRLDLLLAADRAAAQLAVRLCSVAPDGTSLRVSYGVLNLSHRDGSAAPRPMQPGRSEAVGVTLNVAGHRFPKGHRIRLAVSTAYWPLVWPAAEAATLTLAAGGRLTLPLRHPGADEAPVTFAAPPHIASTPTTLLREGRMERTVAFDGLTGVATVTTRGEGGLFGEGVRRFDEIGVSLSHDLTRRLSIAADEPLSATATIKQRYEMERAEGVYVIETVLVLTATAEAFLLDARLDAYEREHVVRTREWRLSVPRLHL